MMSKRERKMRLRMRRDPEGRVALSIADFLKSKGWNVLMTTGARVEQPIPTKANKFQFVIEFVGVAPRKDAK